MRWLGDIVDVLAGHRPSFEILDPATELGSSRCVAIPAGSAWHLGLTDGANDETKARHAFVFGDFRCVHRMGLIACRYRAAEWQHKEIELAAHDLLRHGRIAAGPPRGGEQG